MDSKEALIQALAFLNEIGESLKFDEFLKEKGYTESEIEEMWDENA